MHSYMHAGVYDCSDRNLAMMQAQDSTSTSGSASSGVGAKQEPITVGKQICCQTLIVWFMLPPRFEYIYPFS